MYICLIYLQMYSCLANLIKIAKYMKCKTKVCVHSIFPIILTCISLQLFVYKYSCANASCGSVGSELGMVSMRMQVVISLALLGGLRSPHDHKPCSRSQMQVGSGVALALV